MYSIFNESLGWSETQLPTEKLLLITDSLSADGAFLLPHFINLFVKSKQRVVLVGLEQGFSHYLSVCKKLGVNLQQAHASGHFTYINAIAAPYDWTDAVTTETNNSNAAALQGIANANPFSLSTKDEHNDSVDPLEQLLRLVEKHVMTNDSKSVCLLFDNLSALTHVVGEERLILFVQTCRSLIESHTSAKGAESCLVVLAHKDVDPLLVSGLSHAADLVMKVDGFRTGYSNEEDGQLSFFCADPFKYRDHKLPVLIYKAAETTVNFRVVRK